jgi:NADH-quinone oxidoreductase subunit H
MDPIGLAPLAIPETKPLSDVRAPLDDQRAHWTLGELAYTVALFGGLLIIIAVSGFAMAAGVWVFHLAAHLIAGAINPNYSRQLADAWGNAVGTVLVIVLGFVMILATLLTMGERKWSAFIQDRMGPNRARLPIPFLKNQPLWGLPHILADVLKMLTKEELVPAEANKIIFHLAPALAFGPAFVLFAVIPMAPTFNMGFTWGTHSFVYPITMQVASINQGLLYIFAIASLAVLGTSLAGWSSNNKYALLGGVRASAQMISYEVTLGLTLVGLMLVYQTLRLDTMAADEGKFLWDWVPAWGFVFQPLAIFAYFAAASAEIKRAPFDLPEGESEIVGYFIEYSGLKFGIFMIAEFVEVVVFAGLFTTLFFGGYHLPWGEEWIKHFLYERLDSTFAQTMMGTLFLTTFLVKTVFFCWLSLTVRWTFPRFRYDQVMDLGWKMLLPLSLLNVVVTAFAVLIGHKEGAAVVGLIELVILFGFAIGALTLTRTGDETLLPSGTATPAAAAHGDHH